MRIVLDTNVLLSATFFPGTCAAVLDRCLILPTAKIVLSEYILREFTEHATGKFKAPPNQVEAAVGLLRRRSLIVVPAEVPAQVVDDVDDLPVIGTAVTAQADWLVTGDRALCAVERYEATRIVSPGQFRELLSQEDEPR